MQKLNKLTLIFLLMLGALVISCDDRRSQAGMEKTDQVEIGTEEDTAEGDTLKKEEMSAAVNQSIIQVAENQESLSTFANVVENARMIETLQDVGPYTIFAPSNEAFDQLPEGRLEEIMAMPREELHNFLGHHMIDMKLSAAELKDGMTIDMLDGRKVVVQYSDGAITIDGAKVVNADLEADNGVIHIVDKVLSTDKK